MSGRIHRAGRVGTADASVIATWAEGSSIADIEEAIKQAAREGIRAARTTVQARQ